MAPLVGPKEQDGLV